MESTKQLKCKDLVQSSWESQEEDYKNFKDEGDFESLFDYANQTALSFDKVEKYTHRNKRSYYRLQLSWGGPSTEFRAYLNADHDIDFIEYWYLDWFDGACINIPRDTKSWEVMQNFVEFV